MSNWLYLIADTLADARLGNDEPEPRRRRNPLSPESIGRSLVGLENTHDSVEQRAVRHVLYKLFKRD